MLKDWGDQFKLDQHAHSDWTKPRNLSWKLHCRRNEGKYRSAEAKSLDPEIISWRGIKRNFKPTLNGTLRKGKQKDQHSEWMSTLTCMIL